MCTVTLQYDRRSALARSKMAALMATGLFTQIANQSQKQFVTAAMRRQINMARKEYAEGQTVTCKTPQEMQQFFDSL